MVCQIAGRQKFDIPKESHVRIVLNECGTEVDGEYYEALCDSGGQGGLVLMLLRWTPGNSPYFA